MFGPCIYYRLTGKRCDMDTTAIAQIRASADGGALMPIEMLTYAAPGERLNCSPEAAPCAGHGLPASVPLLGDRPMHGDRPGRREQSRSQAHACADAAPSSRVRCGERCKPSRQPLRDENLHQALCRHPLRVSYRTPSPGSKTCGPNVVNTNRPRVFTARW